MTWQRIDENTYIDDTLVTCAEYQLFIDEMREQEKYYQPDHWASHLFQNRHARRPVLGVRQSDASAFCEWLSKRERQKWKFRLPVREEAASLPLIVSNIIPLGYWLSDSNFFWVDNVANSNRAFPRHFPDALTNAVTCDFMNRNIIVRTVVTISSEAYDFRRTVTSNIERVNANPLDLDNYNNIILGIIQYSANTIYREIYRDIVIDTFLEQVREYANKIVYPSRRFKLGRRRTTLENYIIMFELRLQIYIDLYTLQERIAGRSPAFEGIRLVKERIR